MDPNLLTLIIIVVVCWIIWRAVSPGLTRKSLDAKFNPMPPSEAAALAQRIRDNDKCEEIRVQGVTMRIPEEWSQRSGVIEASDLLVSPPPGFYIHWRTFEWKRLNSPEELMKQVRTQAKLRRWTLTDAEYRNVGGMEAVDAVAEARNGVTHRFVNFCHDGREYFCEIKADTPRLYESAASIFDALINTIEPT